MGYQSNALKGLTWMSGFRVFTRLLAFVKIGVLARVLSPSQFGVFGIASLILALLEILTETGINIILVQSKRSIEEYLDSAWVVSIIRGTVISLLIIISAPFIVNFFNSPESLPILLFMSLVPFVRGFINPAEIVLQKELRFGSEFWFRSVIFFVDACVSIIVALLTHSVYALVWGLLAGAVFEVVLSFILFVQRPRLILHREYFSELFHKGKWITAYGIFNYIAENGDNIIVGRVMGSANLGLYQMAYKISILPISEISDVVSRVVFPVYTKISGDKERLLKAFSKTIASMSIVSFVVGLLIFVFPKEIILVFLGDKWLAAVPVLKILSLYGVIRTIAGPASALFLALEKQNYVTIMTSIRFFVLAISIYPFVLTWGLVGAAYAMLLSTITEMPVILYFAYRVFKK